MITRAVPMAAEPAGAVSNGEQAMKLMTKANQLLVEAMEELGKMHPTVVHAAVTCADPRDDDDVAEHLKDRDYTVGKVTNAHESEGITLLGPDGTPYLLEKAIMIDSGAEINAVVRPVAVRMGLKLRPTRQAMAVFACLVGRRM